MRVKDENKRKAIYEAAMAVINENGLANASMSKIAKSAGVSPSTIYVYFENKEDMLNKLYLMVKKESSEFLFKDFSNDIGIKEGIGSFLRNSFIYMKEHPVRFSFHEQFYNSPNISDEAKAEGINFYQPLFNLYHRAVDEKAIRTCRPELIAIFLIPTIMSLVRMDSNDEIAVDNTILDEVVEMVWQAIKA